METLESFKHSPSGDVVVKQEKENFLGYNWPGHRVFDNSYRIWNEKWVTYYHSIVVKDSALFYNVLLMRQQGNPYPRPSKNNSRSMHSIYGMRKRCSHNLRIRLSDGSLPCLVCVCAEIDDSLITECNGNRKLSSACINDIIHRFRIINSVLDDVPIQPNTIEEHLSPVLRTSIAVLKIDNDEVGTLVSQALDKICPKVPMYMLEKFLGDLSAQILEKTTFGNLESLSVLIRRKECLNCFLKFHGQQLLPKLFQVLKKHAENYSCFKNTVLLETNNSVANSTTNKNSSLKVLGKTVETLEAICSRDVLFVADREHESLQFESETFSVLFEHLKDVISSCMKLLNSTEITNMPAFSAKILSFLDRLLQYAETLRCLVANNLDVPFCSMIKKLLFNRSLEVKSAVLSVVHQMILTYMHTMGDEKAEKGLIADFPSVIFQVDLIHFITEAMNMSSGIAFITTLQILDKISLIPVFQQGRMIPVLESILRVSSISSLDHGNDMSVYESLNSLIANILRTMEPITPGIQFQLLHLFERLPSEWTTLQFLPWIKLLYFCREVELLSRLWSILIIFVERNKNVGSCYCVSSLKCFLLIAFAVMNCKCPDDALVEDNAEVSQQEALINKIMNYLRDVSFLPPLLALITYGTSEDSEYVSIILELMINFPVDKMKPFKAFGVPNQTVFKVIFDSEISGDVMPDVNEDPEYEIKADSDLLENRDGVWWWSPKCYLHLLACIRLNLEFMNSRKVFDLWNANVARIISLCHPQYLPQFEGVLLQEETNQNDYKGDGQEFIRHVLEKLDLNIRCWAKMVGRNSKVDSCSAVDCIFQQKLTVILAFYFFYVLFTGKDIILLVDEPFLERLSIVLDDCVQQYTLTQEEKEELGWTRTSFHYRIALIIASSLSQKCPSLLLDKFEVLMLEVEESLENFKDDVMIYQSSVFVFLFRHDIFPRYVPLVEMWMEQDEESCRWFYTNGKFDDELNTAVNNSLIALAAKGNTEISMLAVELAEKRLKRYRFSFDFSYIKANLHELIRKIPLEDDAEGDTNTLARFSNVVKLAVKDEYLFSLETQFPTDFLHHIIKIMLKFHNESMIGKRCLELISKMLMNPQTLQNVNQYLSNHEQFIRFLGSQIGKLEEDIEGPIFVFTLLATLIKHNLEKFTNKAKNQESVWINWKLSSVFSYIHRVAKLEILEFLLAIFKTNFKCPLIQIEELDLPSAEFAKILLNLLFHLQALLHKVSSRESKEAIWAILFELLRHAEQGIVVKQSTFQTDVLFQPWFKVAVTYLLPQCVFPSNVPLISLEFLQKWTKLILLNKLENRSNRSPLQQSFLFQPYSSVFTMIRDAMKRDPSQLSQQDRLKITTVRQGSSTVFDIERKSGCIARIIKTCETFLATLQ